MVGKQDKKEKKMKRKKKREEGEKRGEKTKQRRKVKLGLMEMRREMGELEARDEGGGERLKKTHTLQRRTPALQTSQLSPEAIDLSGTISRVRGKEGVESFGR